MGRHYGAWVVWSRRKTVPGGNLSKTVLPVHSQWPGQAGTKWLRTNPEPQAQLVSLRPESYSLLLRCFLSLALHFKTEQQHYKKPISGNYPLSMMCTFMTWAAQTIRQPFPNLTQNHSITNRIVLHLSHAGVCFTETERLTKFAGCNKTTSISHKSWYSV